MICDLAVARVIYCFIIKPKIKLSNVYNVQSSQLIGVLVQACIIGFLLNKKQFLPLIHQFSGWPGASSHHAEPNGTQWDVSLRHFNKVCKPHPSSTDSPIHAPFYHRICYGLGLLGIGKHMTLPTWQCLDLCSQKPGLNTAQVGFDICLLHWGGSLDGWGYPPGVWGSYTEMLSLYPE